MIESFLQKVSIFSSLRDDDIGEIAKILNRVKLPANTVLFQEGDRGDSLYVILEGEVEVTKRLGSPEEQVIRVLGRGDYFGEMSCFNPREIRSASVRTRTSAQLLQLERGAFDTLLSGRPAMVETLLRDMVTRLSNSEENLIRGLRRKNLQIRKQCKLLLESENLAALGRTLATLAHDFKTPLIAIGGFAHIVHRHLEERNPDREKLEIVLRETQRLESMVKNMLDFVRPLDLHYASTHVGQLVTDSLAVLGPVAQAKQVTVERSLSEEDIPPVPLDAARMEQALINLVLNAVEASPAGQTVTVHCHRVEEDLVLDVVDRGCGIPPERRQRIFTPFFTTKKGGSGLGLAIVSKIVHAHSGCIQVTDTPGGGTTFRIRIPLGT